MSLDRSRRESVEKGIAQWADLLGRENVHVDHDSIVRAETATFHTTQAVHAIVRPGSRSEVQDVIRIANQYGIPIYPVSCGKNWGYGSGVPVCDSCVVDLSRMNRIVDFDEDLAYATIEPGVTMESLHQFLQSRGSNLMLSVTGSAPDTSIIGNVVERGVAVGPYGYRFQHVCALEVVLPTGECVNTGFAAYKNAASAKTSKYGVGPTLDGLFSQSNLGVVTQMTVWLRPQPAHFQTVFAVADEHQLEGLMDELRALALVDALQPTFGVWNDYKLLAAMGQYPWERARGATPLPDDTYKEMTRGLGRWVLSAALYSNSARHAAADRKLVKRALRKVTRRILFFDSRRAALAKTLSGPIRVFTGFDLGRWIDNIYTKSTFLGIPSSVPMRQAYWRKKEPIPESLNPDRDRCGVVCCAPALPFEGKATIAVVSCMEKLSLAYGFEPNITLLCVTPRQIDAATLLIYDRDEQKDEARALECHDEMMAALIEQGHFPYRLGIQSMHLLPRPTDDSAQLHRILKRALDPRDVLASGRYDLRRHWKE
jgi:FAD binding domain